jgi:hypothetical protein
VGKGQKLRQIAHFLRVSSVLGLNKLPVLTIPPKWSDNTVSAMEMENKKTKKSP